MAPALRISVIMDNLGSHNSPDLNPIEQVFAKLKTLLRKTDPRTTEAAWRGIGILLDRFKPEKCANYLVNLASG